MTREGGRPTESRAVSKLRQHGRPLPRTEAVSALELLAQQGSILRDDDWKGAGFGGRVKRSFEILGPGGEEPGRGGESRSGMVIDKGRRPPGVFGWPVSGSGAVLQRTAMERRRRVIDGRVGVRACVEGELRTISDLEEFRGERGAQE